MAIFVYFFVYLIMVMYARYLYTRNRMVLISYAIANIILLIQWMLLLSRGK
jgi:hypothetical protein